MADERKGMFGETGKKIAEKGSEFYREMKSKGEREEGEESSGERDTEYHEEKGGPRPGEATGEAHRNE